MGGYGGARKVAKPISKTRGTPPCIGICLLCLVVAPQHTGLCVGLKSARNGMVFYRIWYRRTVLIHLRPKWNVSLLAPPRQSHSPRIVIPNARLGRLSTFVSDDVGAAYFTVLTSKLLLHCGFFGTIFYHSNSFYSSQNPTFFCSYNPEYHRTRILR
jgi:hypothetical protein